MKRQNWISTMVIAGAVAGLLWTGAQPASADAKELYNTKCKKCHGADGKGDTAQGKKEKVRDMTAADFKVTEAEAVKAVLQGYESKGGGKMKKVEGISEAEAKELFKVVQSFKK